MGTLPASLADVEMDIRDCCRGTFGAEVLGARPTEGGHSGFTFSVDLDTDPGRVAVRISPPGARPVGPADVLRQSRIMRAVRAADVPVPTIIEARMAASGRPFVVMEWVAGETFAEAATQCAIPELLDRVMEVLARLHMVPASESGIADEQARPPAWAVERWVPLMNRAPREVTGRAANLAQRLLQCTPVAATVSLVHGDYHHGNLLFINGQVGAVLDWEIAELGSPQVDVACLCLPAIQRACGVVAVSGDPEVPLDMVLERAQDYSDLQWFLAAACYKYAAILGYNLDLHRRGRRLDPMYEDLASSLPTLIDFGFDLLDDDPAT